MSFNLSPKRTRSPWFAFYPDDWTGGTRVMTLAARGAYLDLLAYQFASGPIPKDDRAICRIIGAFPDEWDTIKGEILPKFEETESGFVNRRMEKEADERSEIRSKRVEAINKRWNKPNTNEIQTGYKSIDSVDTSPSPSPSPSIEVSCPSDTLGFLAKAEGGPNGKKPRVKKDYTAEFDQFWQAYPKKKAKEDAARAFATARSKTDLQTMLDAIAAQKLSQDWQKDGGQFIPFPATWLRAGQWADQPTEIIAPTAKKVDYSKGFFNVRNP